MQEIQGNWTRETCENPCNNNVRKGIKRVNENKEKSLSK
ncbi:hypothetical protein EBGED10_3620 [Bacillus sp. GeD10]|nr:hypothetical protein EBGED10_3620 [Bacillus sp. GeD10]